MDRNNFLSENRNQPRYNENTILTQTTYRNPAVSIDTFDTQIQTRSCRNQSLAIQGIRENSMEIYEDNSNVRQPTVHFEPATQLTKNHTTNSSNEHFRNLKSVLHQIRDPRININMPKTQLMTYSREPSNGTSGIVISNQQYLIMFPFRTQRNSAVSKTLSQIAQRKAF